MNSHYYYYVEETVMLRSASGEERLLDTGRRSPGLTGSAAEAQGERRLFSALQLPACGGHPHADILLPGGDPSAGGGMLLFNQ